MEGTNSTRKARSTPSLRGIADATRGGVRQAGRSDRLVAGWLALLALALFALLALLVGRGETAAADDAVRLFVLAHRPTRLVAMSRWISIVGSVTPMVVYAILVALLLALRNRRRVAATILVAPAGAVTVYLGLKNVFARSRPSGVGNVIEGTSSFPSAHATTSAAVCCTLAYICWRERLLPRSASLALGVVTPFLIGASRVFLDAHWATDVLGGWFAGICIAAVASVLYQLVRRVDAGPPPDEVGT